MSIEYIKLNEIGKFNTMYADRHSKSYKLGKGKEEEDGDVIEMVEVPIKSYTNYWKKFPKDIRRMLITYIVPSHKHSTSGKQLEEANPDLLLNDEMLAYFKLARVFPIPTAIYWDENIFFSNGTLNNHTERPGDFYLHYEEKFKDKLRLCYSKYYSRVNSESQFWLISRNALKQAFDHVANGNLEALKKINFEKININTYRWVDNFSLLHLAAYRYAED